MVQFTREELVSLTRGMAYDTATMLEDVARGLNSANARHVINVAHVLRDCANHLTDYANATPDPPTRG